MKRILQTGVFWVVMFFIVIGGVTGTDCVRAEERSFPEDFFDANWYYFKHHNENAEIAAMKENTEGLKNHYYTKGITLGYSPSVAFDPKEYIQLNDDLAKAFGNYTDAYNHFLQHVFSEMKNTGLHRIFISRNTMRRR